MSITPYLYFQTQFSQNFRGIARRLLNKLLCQSSNNSWHLSLFTCVKSLSLIHSKPSSPQETEPPWTPVLKPKSRCHLSFMPPFPSPLHYNPLVSLVVSISKIYHETKLTSQGTITSLPEYFSSISTVLPASILTSSPPYPNLFSTK